MGLVTVATGICQQRLLLQDAIAKALKYSLDIQLANNNWQIAQINNHPGFAGALPTVTAGITDNEQLSSTSQKFALLVLYQFLHYYQECIKPIPDSLPENFGLLRQALPQ